MVKRQTIGLKSWRRDQDQLVLHEGLGPNAAIARWSFDEADGELVIEEKLHDLAGVAAMQGELDTRVLVEEGYE